MFISIELDMNYTNKKIGMFISRPQKDRQGSGKSYHKGQNHCLRSLQIGYLQKWYVIEPSVLFQEEC